MSLRICTFKTFLSHELCLRWIVRTSRDPASLFAGCNSEDEAGMFRSKLVRKHRTIVPRSLRCPSTPFLQNSEDEAGMFRTKLVPKHRTIVPRRMRCPSAPFLQKVNLCLTLESRPARKWIWTPQAS